MRRDPEHRAGGVAGRVEGPGACAVRVLRGGRPEWAGHVRPVRGAQRGGAVRDALGPVVPDPGGGVHRGAGAAGHAGPGHPLRPAEPACGPGRGRPRDPEGRPGWAWGAGPWQGEPRGDDRSAPRGLTDPKEAQDGLGCLGESRDSC